MDFDMPQDLVDFLVELDDFIETEIKPLEQENDNIRFLDHRREDARTDWDRGGLPNAEWEELMREARAPRRRGRPSTATRSRSEYGGMDGTNLGMAVIREHLAAQGSRAALRPAERAHHRRQQRRPDAHVSSTAARQQKAEWLSTTWPRHGGGFAFGITELEPRLRRHVDGDQRRRATVTSG